MRDLTTKDAFEFLKNHNATCLGNHRNDLGQVMEFYEHPIYGDESPIYVLFPNYEVAFNSGYFDLEDMTATYHSIGMFLNEKDEDMGYVPRFLDGKMIFKFEVE